MFHTVYTIADTLVKLHAQGCVQFIGWEHKFCIWKDSIKELRDIQKNLSRELKLWEEAINTARNECYPLNSFTVQQLLFLCKELFPAHNGEYKDILHPQAIALLKYQFPCSDVETLVSTVNCSWKLLEEPVNAVEQLQVKENEVIVTESYFGPLPKTNSLTCEQIVETMLTPFERTVYAKLTKSTGYNKVWVIAEILQRSPHANNETEAENALDEILEKILRPNEPDEEKLVCLINGSLKGEAVIQFESSEDHTAVSDDIETQQTDEDSRNVQSYSSIDKTHIANM